MKNPLTSWSKAARRRIAEAELTDLLVENTIERRKALAAADCGNELVRSIQLAHAETAERRAVIADRALKQLRGQSAAWVPGGDLR